MGSHSSGPAFLPWYVSPPPTDSGTETARSALDQSSAAFRPPRNRWPAVMTVLAVLIVGVVVAVSTVVALREDRRPVASRIVSPRSPAAVPTDRMEFVTGTADGVLIVADRVWSSTRGATTGLRQLPARRGGTGLPDRALRLRTRRTFLPSTPAASCSRSPTPAAGARRSATGSSAEGESVRGTIAFDLPRGEVTLLMSDDASQAVTALKIPD